LLGRKGLNPGEALIMKPCKSIHTLFLNFPVDVLFVDKNNKVIALITSLKPWRVSAVYLRAEYAIELPCGMISKSLTTEGDEMVIY